jgi:hypothetical protein
MVRDHRDLELLSEVFGRYMRLWWFSAHEVFEGNAEDAPSAGETGRAAARAAGETQYRQFKQGHRFIDDLPVEPLGGEDDVK